MPIKLVCLNLNRCDTRQQPVPANRPASRANQKAAAERIYQCTYTVERCMYTVHRCLYNSWNVCSHLYTEHCLHKHVYTCLYIVCTCLYDAKLVCKCINMYIHVWTMYIHVYSLHCTYHVHTMYIHVYDFSVLYIPSANSIPIKTYYVMCFNMF